MLPRKGTASDGATLRRQVGLKIGGLARGSFDFGHELAPEAELPKVSSGGLRGRMTWMQKSQKQMMQIVLGIMLKLFRLVHQSLEQL